MDITNLIISLVGGAIGGNIAGPATKEKNLGVVGNTLAGIVGGPLGVYILQALNILGSFGTGTAAVGAVTGIDLMDWSALLKNLAAGGGCGAILTALIAYAKSAMEKK